MIGLRHGCRLRRHGFTLLELLVALAVSGLLLAVLSQTLGSLQLAVHRALSVDANGDELERGRQMLATLLAAALPAAAEDVAAGFVGRSDRADFVASPPDALSRLGPLRVRLLVAPAGRNQLGLFAELRTARSGGTAAPALQRDLLIGGLQWAQLAYSAGAAGVTGSVGGASATMAFQDQWVEPGRLPALVQVRWRLADEDGERQPVTVAIRRNLSGGCRFDPISLTCRGRDGQ
jgi:prepilin-type N-terminal cleavage/methylation domain-containing protein